MPIATSLAPSAGPAYRVLIVDDSTDAPEMLSLAFSELGRDTQVAYDGPAALRLTENFQPRLALLDIGLPGMNGYALARQFRLRAGSDDISLIAVTRYGRKSDIALVLQSGFDEHLVKPVEFEKLQALLLRVLRK